MIFVLLIYLENNYVNIPEYQIMNAKNLNTLIYNLCIVGLDKFREDVVKLHAIHKDREVALAKLEIYNILYTDEEYVLYLVKMINYKWPKYQRLYQQAGSKPGEYFENPFKTMRLDRMLLGDYLRVVKNMETAEYIASFIKQAKLEGVENNSGPVKTSFPLEIYRYLYSISVNRQIQFQQNANMETRLGPTFLMTLD